MYIFFVLILWASHFSLFDLHFHMAVCIDGEGFFRSKCGNMQTNCYAILKIISICPWSVCCDFTPKDGSKPLQSRFLLSDQVYCTAEVPPTEKVMLWLGVRCYLFILLCSFLFSVSLEILVLVGGGWWLRFTLLEGWTQFVVPLGFTVFRWKSTRRLFEIAHFKFWLKAGTLNWGGDSTNCTFILAKS